mmetsp:Transcript_32527/g.63662  ORF Transcript_32527/g.63662 Transcript_32527/m.63662 type:complete len:307 (-) Transcript_32527:172-1092(-)
MQMCMLEEQKQTARDADARSKSYCESLGENLTATATALRSSEEERTLLEQRYSALQSLVRDKAQEVSCLQASLADSKSETNSLASLLSLRAEDTLLSDTPVLKRNTGVLSGSLKRWNKRWLRLTTHRLIWARSSTDYANSATRTHKDAINLGYLQLSACVGNASVFTGEDTEASKSRCVISVPAISRTYFFQMASEEEAEKWVGAINGAVGVLRRHKQAALQQHPLPPPSHVAAAAAQMTGRLVSGSRFTQEQISTNDNDNDSDNNGYDNGDLNLSRSNKGNRDITTVPPSPTSKASVSLPASEDL